MDKFQFRNLSSRLIVEALLSVASLVLLSFAYLTDRAWLDRHFLPTFFLSRNVYYQAAFYSRAAIALIGIVLFVFVRPRLGRIAAHLPVRVLLADLLSGTLAVTLALGTSELVLRHVFWRATEERPSNEEPSRQRDARLGWVFAPARTGFDTVNGRTIEYAFDASGYRVRRADQPVDHDRPSIVFAGESVMAGHALNWDETVPAQVEALLGIQSANLAVNGFATDQAYLRLSDELPGFRHPLAVVFLFAPALFDRNLDDDRPHLGPGLAWMPAQNRWRLTTIARWLVPYRSDTAIARGIALTRQILRATVDLARMRGAVSVILVPQFTPEGSVERMLRLRILDDSGLPYLWVPLDPSWRIPGDGHPDARATRAMAIAVAGRVRELMAAPSNTESSPESATASQLRQH